MQHSICFGRFMLLIMFLVWFAKRVVCKWLSNNGISSSFSSLNFLIFAASFFLCFNSRSKYCLCCLRHLVLPILFWRLFRAATWNNTKIYDPVFNYCSISYWSIKNSDMNNTCPLNEQIPHPVLKSMRCFASQLMYTFHYVIGAFVFALH